MDRRESLKTLMIGGVAGVTIGTTGCDNLESTANEDTVTEGLYGRTPEEVEWDKKVQAQSFLEEHELSTIATLCDIILPATATAGSATEAGVVEFVDFIVKDLPDHQLPLRGGLMWLDIESNRRFNKRFIDCGESEMISIVDDIAYPDPEGKKPEMGPGIAFFNRMRNLTLTGYYTTKLGMDDLGYVGNVPNMWDGVPENVLNEHDVDYDQDWLARCVDQSKREVIAEWDEDGNLLT